MEEHAKHTREVIEINPLKKQRLKLHLVGTSDLILNKKARSFEEAEIYRQSHKDGSTMPEKFNSKTNYNLWEKLCTSIHWKDPVPVFPEYSDYTEEIWRDWMQNNQPCILSKSFSASFYETFVSFGYKDATGKNGTDFKRTVNLEGAKNPITFASVTYSQHLTPNTGISKTNVLAQHNIFSGWACDINIIFVPSVFQKETIIEIISTAGEFIGVGTKRAEGWGHYHIGEVEVSQA